MSMSCLPSVLLYHFFHFSITSCENWLQFMTNRFESSIFCLFDKMIHKYHTKNRWKCRRLLQSHRWVQTIPTLRQNNGIVEWGKPKELQKKKNFNINWKVRSISWIIPSIQYLMRRHTSTRSLCDINWRLPRLSKHKTIDRKWADKFTRYCLIIVQDG